MSQPWPRDTPRSRGGRPRHYGYSLQPKVTAECYGLRAEKGWDAGLDFLETYQRTLTPMKTMVLPEG
ncbi:hypothetical protein [Acidilobus sp. 7A]|uniref:hypothetical protein n=1 Tax=Acidilobus sp. 7A TaxID=1577685 RepID=UPI0011E4D286|nr:hypothetical protein [Acidilobus sp. 7A]